MSVFDGFDVYSSLLAKVYLYPKPTVWVVSTSDSVWWVSVDTVSVVGVLWGHQAPAFSEILIWDGIFAKSRDPGIFRDGIDLIIWSRDWCDSGIFRDWISLKFSSLVFFYILLETNKSCWNHCFVSYDKSCWGLVVTVNVVGVLWVSSLWWHSLACCMQAGIRESHLRTSSPIRRATLHTHYLYLYFFLHSYQRVSGNHTSTSCVLSHPLQLTCTQLISVKVGDMHFDCVWSNSLLSKTCVVWPPYSTNTFVTYEWSHATLHLYLYLYLYL